MIDHGLVFDALVLPKHLPALRELVARYPDLRMVLDHGAKPPIATGDLADWKREIAALARETPASSASCRASSPRPAAPIPACCAPASSTCSRISARAA